MTLSLTAVFIPLLLMGGLIGRLFREFAVTVSMAIIISGVVSPALTPMMGAWLLRPHEAADEENRILAALERGFAVTLDSGFVGTQQPRAHHRREGERDYTRNDEGHADRDGKLA